MSRVLSNHKKSNSSSCVNSIDNINRTTQLLVDAEHAEQRLDNFLISKLKGVPKSLIYRLVRQGKIRINRKKVSVNERLNQEDCIAIPGYLRYNANISASSNNCNANSRSNFSSDCRATGIRPPSRLQQLLIDSILTENAQFIVLNKPSGVAVHGGSGVNFGIIETVRSIKPAWQKLELAHRLDRDSSGCLLLAKKRRVISAFQQAAAAQHTTKYYLMLVPGQFPNTPQQVNLPLKKNQLKSGERVVVVDHANGKPSSTTFNLVEQYQDCALIGATLQSGRTHQIRVHAASIGFPLAGDEKYGDRDFNAAMRKLGLTRLFLHAYILNINWLDDSLEKISIQAPIEPSLRQLLSRIRAASFDK